MELFIRLWNALNSLPEIQGRRIDTHIILGKSIKEIAEAEGVHEESIRQSIKRGLERMKKTFPVLDNVYYYIFFLYINIIPSYVKIIYHICANSSNF